MIVNKYGRVAGSVDLAALAQMYAQATDEDLKAHYREVAAGSGVDLDEVSYEETPEPELEPEPEPQRPADYAAKADWVAWAVYCGADEADASSATKAELIELYGGAED